MKYVLERISTVQACDALLAGAQKKKQTLESRRRNLGESLGTFRKRLDQLNQESGEVELSLVVFTAAYEGLPEGKDKLDVNIRVKRLELRQAVLEKKALTYNVATLLVKELQYNRLDSQLSALEEYIHAVELQRISLNAVPMRMIQPATVSRGPIVREHARFSMPPFAYAGRGQDRAGMLAPDYLGSYLKYGSGRL